MPDIASVVVTGLGVVSPLGPLNSFWRGICAGESGISEIDAFDPGPKAPRKEARVRNWEPREHTRAALLRRMDRFSQMVVVACRSALIDAELRLSADDAETAGVVVGTAYGNLAESEQFLRRLFAKGPALANPLAFPNTVLNASAGYVAIDLGLRGPNFTVCRGEVSGEAALAVAYDMIASGQADVLLAGGGDEIAPVLFCVYRDLGVLSPGDGGRSSRGRRSKLEPWVTRLEHSSPFDRSRNGFVMGEGAAMLVLERADHAAARGARMYAELAGYVTQTFPSSPHDWPLPAAVASVEVGRKLARLGWRQPWSGTNSKTGETQVEQPTGPLTDGISLVVSCANSTASLDSFEAVHLARLLGETAQQSIVTSVKGAIGEFGGAGAFSAAAAVLALQSGTMPLLGTLDGTDPAFALRFATTTTQPPDHGFDAALVSGSPRGGGCMTLLFRKARS